MKNKNSFSSSTFFTFLIIFKYVQNHIDKQDCKNEVKMYQPSIVPLIIIKCQIDIIELQYCLSMRENNQKEQQMIELGKNTFFMKVAKIFKV